MGADASGGEKWRQPLPSGPMSSTSLLRAGIVLPTLESGSLGPGPVTEEPCPAWAGMHLGGLQGASTKPGQAFAFSLSLSFSGGAKPWLGELCLPG